MATMIFVSSWNSEVGLQLRNRLIRMLLSGYQDLTCVLVLADSDFALTAVRYIFTTITTMMIVMEACCTSSLLPYVTLEGLTF